MKIKNSDFNIIDIVFDRFSLEFCPPENHTRIVEVLASIELDFDFDIQEIKNTNFIAIFLTIKGNHNKESFKGYKFLIHGMGTFEIKNRNEIIKQELDNFLLLSGLPMVISSFRAYLLNITSNFPLGKYCLPGIDLNEFIDSKMKIIHKESK